MEEKEMSTKQKLVVTGITLGSAALFVLLANHYHKKAYINPEQSGENQTPKSSQVTNQDYAFMAAVYESESNKGEFITSFRNDQGKFEFYKATEERPAKSGDGVLAELDRSVWTKYGTALCSKVLESMGNHQILREGDMLRDLEPIPTIDKDILKTDYDLKVAYGTGHNLFGEAKNITDIVNQK